MISGTRTAYEAHMGPKKGNVLRGVYVWCEGRPEPEPGAAVSFNVTHSRLRSSDGEIYVPCTQLSAATLQILRLFRYPVLAQCATKTMGPLATAGVDPIPDAWQDLELAAFFQTPLTLLFGFGHSHTSIGCVYLCAAHFDPQAFP